MPHPLWILYTKLTKRCRITPIGGILALEIELKVRLGDFAPVKERLSALGSYLRSYKKSDSYWVPIQADPPELAAMPDLRVRRERGLDSDGQIQDSTLVTYKTKEISGGIEVNDEREFTVSDAGLFEELMGRLGLYKDICKEKEGWAWIISPDNAEQSPAQSAILAELSLVTGLGWFLELEIMADNDESTVAESRARLLETLKKLEIPAESMEARPYTAMLREV
jgi:predicted adenylyl cyclase CyaB